MPVKFADVDKEFEKDSDLKQDDVRILREWLAKQPHLPQINDLRLICFLHCAYCKPEKAKILIENFYAARTHAPELFQNKSLVSKPFEDQIKILCLTLLPQTTDEGHLVIYGRIMDTNASILNFNEAFKAFDMGISLLQLQRGIAPGHVLVLDSQGLSLSHASKVNFASCIKIAYYLQECYPHRLKGIHIINVSPITEKLFVLVKPLIKKEFVDIIYFHPKIDGLYKFVPKKVMPKEYDGDAPSYKDMHAESVQNLKDNHEFFEKENQELVDEKKRIGRPKTTADIFGMEGTFRKLEID